MLMRQQRIEEMAAAQEDKANLGKRKNAEASSDAEAGMLSEDDGRKRKVRLLDQGSIKFDVATSVDEREQSTQNDNEEDEFDAGMVRDYWGLLHELKEPSPVKFQVQKPVQPIFKVHIDGALSDDDDEANGAYSADIDSMLLSESDFNQEEFDMKIVLASVITIVN